MNKYQDRELQKNNTIYNNIWEKTKRFEIESANLINGKLDIEINDIEVEFTYRIGKKKLKIKQDW